MTGETPEQQSAREFDVVVFGATGFVGELTARYLAEHAPDCGFTDVTSVKAQVLDLAICLILAATVVGLLVLAL